MSRYQLHSPLMTRKGFKKDGIYHGYEQRGLVWLRRADGEEFSFHPAEVRRVK